MGPVLLLALTVAAAPSADQIRRQPGGGQEKVNATINLTVGATAYNFTGQAKCDHLAKGSIFGTIAERWSVSQSEGSRSLLMNLWKPLAGGENLLTLYVSTGSKDQVIDTGAPEKKGSGTVVLAPEGNGGTFTIKGTTDSGAKVSGTIKCDAFTAAVAVAG